VAGNACDYIGTPAKVEWIQQRTGPGDGVEHGLRPSRSVNTSVSRCFVHQAVFPLVEELEVFRHIHDSWAAYIEIRNESFVIACLLARLTLPEARQCAFMRRNI
jgi:hypothetical protein